METDKRTGRLNPITASEINERIRQRRVARELTGKRKICPRCHERFRVEGRAYCRTCKLEIEREKHRQLRERLQAMGISELDHPHRGYTHMRRVVLREYVVTFKGGMLDDGFWWDPSTRVVSKRVG